MLRQIVCIAFLVLGIASLGTANPNPPSDSILFTVGQTPVTISEFRYIYGKTNGAKADFSKKSLDEYLDLYIKFKLKVQKAKDMQLDTIPALKRELDGYRKQLASTYLLDKEVLNNLVEEAHQRMKQDVSISHIFIQVPNSSDGKKELARIENVQRQIKTGKLTFEAAAEEFSEDPSTASEGGYFKYITAFSLKKLYEIESAAYNTNPGQVSDPVRSQFGYHLVKVNAKRPARGEMEIAHILVRVADKAQEAAAQQKIRQAYKDLEKGVSFEDAAKKYTDDANSKNKGGQLGVATINQYEKAFEEYVFTLKNDGDITQPFRSSVGWHIVKRIKKRELAPLNEMKRGLKARIQRDARFKTVQNQFTEKLKKEHNFKLDEANISNLREEIDASFKTMQWRPKFANLEGTAFTFADKKVTIHQLVEFLSKSSGVRVRQSQSLLPKVIFDNLLNTFSSTKLMDYEETLLPEKYPDFKALMREYEEGILLFEATNVLVWGKAAQDSTGLQQFYQKNKKNYTWDERVEVTTYAMPNEHPTKLAKAKKLAKKKTSAQVLAGINTEEQTILSASTSTYEKGQNEEVDKLKWKKNYVGLDIYQGDTVKFLKVEKFIKKQPKQFKDARGYVIADYQEYLETQWVKDLKAAYPVKVNDQLFQSLIK